MVTPFIEELSHYAVKHGRPAGVLPSLIIAQGILESAAGKSELATNACNLFGIKANTTWEGDIFAKVTKEWSAERGWFEITANFRKYPTYEGAVIDLVDKYANGTGWEAHNRYFAVLGETDYVRATEAVHAAGYATDPTYPAKLQRVIEEHDLTRFDEYIDDTDYEKEDEGMVKIAVDAGHGKFTPGKRSPAGEREWYFNDKVVRALIDELNNYENVAILRTDDPTGNTDVGLTERTNKANRWGADAFISCHHNALVGKWANHTGVETFYMEGNSSQSQAARLAAKVHPGVVDAMGIANRGIRTANFAVLRQTAMPAILVEGGFMDSTIDIEKMRDNNRLKAQGIAIARGIAEFFGLKRKAAPAPQPKPIVKPATRLYRVRTTWSKPETQIGAYANLDTAKSVARNRPGYKVYDEDGKLVFDPQKVEPPVNVEPPKEDEPMDYEKHAKPTKSLQQEFAEAVERKLTDGTYPNRPATRAEVVVIVLRAMKQLEAQIAEQSKGEQ
jgi:N-acetylmuramoyl-L-alanine amidase